MKKERRQEVIPFDRECLAFLHSLFSESEMKVHRFEEVSEFYQQVKDYLLSDEAQHCLLLSIVNTLIFYPGRYNCNPYLATVETNGKIVAVAMRTPPRKLLLSKIQDNAAVEAIAQDLHDYSFNEDIADATA